MKRLLAKEEHARAIANIIAGCTVVLFAVLVYRIDGVLAFLSHLMGVLFPLAIGFVIAFLVDPPLTTLERLFHRLFDRLFRKRTPPKIPCRLLAAVIIYVLLIGAILGFMAIVLPQIVDSVRGLIVQLTGFLNSNRPEIEEFLREFNWVDSTGGSMNLFNSVMGYWDQLTAWILSSTGALVKGVVDVSTSVGNVVSQVVIGVVISIYLLFGKEKFAAQAKKIGCSFLPEERVQRLTFWFRKTHQVFSGYIVGQLLASLVVGVICYIVMLCTGMDYALLISVIVGITNIVPVFGPIVGGVAGCIILLVVNFTKNPMVVVWFGLFILVLQQIEGNIIGPRILGDSVGISSFWIILSIVVGGGLFGLPGILLGIPVFAVIYAVAQSLVGEKLKRQGLPSDTQAYVGKGPLPKPKTEK